jgi:Fe-S-cluster containining protein
MADLKLSIGERQRYSCIMCGKCCRRFYVALSDAEVERLSALDWGDTPGVPREFVKRIHGHSYFRRDPRHAGCVFLDPGTGLCRMHGKFGYAIKALSCRGYPLNIASTFPGEVTAIARMDCPAVVRNQGEPLRKRRAEAAAMAREMGIRGGFTQRQLNGLSRDAVLAVTRALVSIVEDPELSPSALAMTLALAVTRFEELGPSFLNDTSTFEDVLPSLLTRVRGEAVEDCPGRLRAFGRGMFREWLAAYCRRDEEPVSLGPLARLRRTVELGKYWLGFGSLAVLGQEHPDLSLRRAGLFAGRDRNAELPASAPGAWDCFRLLLVTRLESFQFFGVTYYDEPFFVGLRALVQSFALVLAAARYHAAAAGRRDLVDEDLFYAVSVIDHCLGRSPLLQFGIWRRVERFFWGKRFRVLLHTLGWV